MKRFPPGHFDWLKRIQDGFKGKFSQEDIAHKMNDLKNLQQQQNATQQPAKEIEWTLE